MQHEAMQRLFERRHVERVDDAAAAIFPEDEARGLQLGEMTRHRGLGHGKTISQIACAFPAVLEHLKNFAPDRMGQGIEYAHHSHLANRLNDSIVQEKSKDPRALGDC